MQLGLKKPNKFKINTKGSGTALKCRKIINFGKYG